MANTIKKQQKKAMKVYLTNAARSVRTTQFPRVKSLGTLAPAKSTLTTTVYDSGPKRTLKTKKKTVKGKKK